MQAKQYNSGFSLVEVLIAVMLIGLAVAALVAANAALTKANGAGTELSNAEFLIGEIAELTALLPYDDLDDFDDASFSPPINSERAPLNDSAGFSQQITVENVSPSNFELVVGDGTTDFVRVSVKIFLNARQISSASWLRARY